MEAWDVIVVGAGAAGLAAAWHARAEGASVLVVNKGGVGRTGATITSGGGISAAGKTVADLGLGGDPSDTEENFLIDTLRAGQYLGDQELVQAMVTGVGEELRRLIDVGVNLTVTRRPPGHSSGRGVRIAGPEMQRVMTREAVRAGVKFREDFHSVGPLLNDGQLVGIGGLDRRAGRAEAIPGRTVVLATGGTTSNWHLKTSPEELTGDGHALALAAGAELIEMEMMQFLPCCLIAPEMWRGLQFPWIIGPQAGVRAWLLNRYGERFLARWDPVNMELSTRDVVSAAMGAEIAAGRGSPNGGVYLSWAHLPIDIVENFPSFSRSISQDWHWEGFDMTPVVERIRQGRALEVAPAAHFSIGGIRIDATGSTGVPGLYACGEATGGLHGGNRLSGNAGAQVLVQGRAAGRSAGRTARAANGVPGAPENWTALRETIEAPMHRRAGIAPPEIKERLTQMAESALGPVRQADRLATALDDLRDLVRNALPEISCRSEELSWNQDWTAALECRAAVPVLESALIGALTRTRSIGAHRRLDDLATDKPVPQHGIIRAQDGRLVHRTVPVAFPYVTPAA